MAKPVGHEKEELNDMDITHIDISILVDESSLQHELMTQMDNKMNI